MVSGRLQSHSAAAWLPMYLVRELPHLSSPVCLSELSLAYRQEPPLPNLEAGTSLLQFLLACLRRPWLHNRCCLCVPPGGPPIQLRSMLGLFRNPFLRFGFLATALTAASHFAAYTYLQPLLGMKLGLAPGQVTLVLLAYGVAGIGGTFAAERLSIYDLRRTFAAAALFLGGAVGTAACAPHPGVAVAAVVLWGAAFGAISVCSQLWTFQAAPQSFEPASAISMTVFQISLSAGSFAGGQLVNLGSVVPAFLLATLLALCCVILLHMTPSPQ